METLDEYNKRQRAAHAEMESAKTRQQMNGIACPKCGAEMHDSDPFSVLASYPPQKDVACGACGYTGCRVA